MGKMGLLHLKDEVKVRKGGWCREEKREGVEGKEIRKGSC